MNRKDRRRLGKTGEPAGGGKAAGPIFGVAPTSVSASLLQGPGGAATSLGPPPQLARAIEHYDAGRWPEAEALCRQVLAIAPGDAEAGMLLGGTLLRMFRQPEAMPYLQRAAVQFPNRAEAQYYLGIALIETGRPGDAVEALQRAVALRPTYFSALFALGHARERLGDFLGAAREFGAAAAANPRDFDARFRQATSLRRGQDFAAALACYRQAGTLDRERQPVEFWIAALGGAPMPPHPPARHLVTLFDEYARAYDQHQREQLHYQVPELLLAAAQQLGLMPPLDILDGGCGTGLCGAAFRTFGGRIDGVDLSPRMLDQARARGGFDRLLQGELTQVLRQSPPGRYDLVLAGDVLPYIGDLQDLFPVVQAALRPEGWFLFTVEQGEGLQLRPNGRYAHGQAYVAEMAEAAGLAPRLAAPGILAEEYRQPSLGTVFALQRR